MTAVEQKPRNTRSLTLQQKEELAGWLMALPSVFLIFLFLIMPFVGAFVMSFTNQRLVSPNPTEWVGLRNFENLLSLQVFTLEPLRDEATGEVLRDEDGEIQYPRLREFTRNNPDYPEIAGMQEWRSWQSGENRTVILARDVLFWTALFNTLGFVIVVAPLQGGLALLLAVLINQKLRGINIFRVIYFMPVVVSMVVVSLLWRFIYDGQNGLLNSVLQFLTFGAFQPVDWLGNPNTAMPALIAMSVWQGVGFHMVIWLSGLQTIPFVLYEAADIDGANTWQKFRYVTLPGLRNTGILILIVITMQAFSLYIQVQVMTRGGPVDATQSLVYQAVIRGFEQQNIAGGSAISVILFLLVLSISLIQRFLTREKS